MPLFSLPNELLIQIGGQLEPKDLDCFIRTNRRLATLLKPILHRIAAHTVLDRKDSTVFTWAIKNDHHTLFGPLLDYGSDIEFLNWANQTPLMVAAAAGKLAAIRLLIDRGAEIAPQASPMSETALHHAAMRGQIEAAKILLEKGADIDAETKGGETPLYWAISDCRNEFSKFLLGKGANVNARNSLGKTVLQHAASLVNEEIFLDLCDKGADVTLSRTEMTVLHTTLRNGGSEKMVRKLLEKGADVTAQTSSCRTVLHCAIDGDVNEKIFQLLLDEGAEVCVNVRETVGWRTPLLRAATDKHRSEREEEARAKLTLDDDVPDTGGVFQKAYEEFLLDAEANREAIVRALVNRGADIHEKDLAGKTSLHEAARNGYVGIVKFLLEKGADVAAKDEQEYTALHRAAEGSFMYRYKDNSGHIKVMRLLLEKGADISSSYRGGWTVRDWGSSGNKLLCDFLEELGQDVEELRAYQSDVDECEVVEAFGSEDAGDFYDYDFDIDFDDGSDNYDNDDNDNDDDDDALSWDGSDSL